jgi:hypothetical protein
MVFTWLRGCCGHDRMVAWFTTTYVISDYHHWRCEFKSHTHSSILLTLIFFGLVWFMVLNATFNNISVISWRSVLLVEQKISKLTKLKNVSKHRTIMALISACRIDGQLDVHRSVLLVEETGVHGENHRPVASH